MIDLGFSQAEIAWGNSIMGEADIRKLLQGIKDIGGRRVRFGAPWNLIEKTRGQYDFTYLDRAVTLCAQYGIKPLLNVLPAGSTKGGGDGTPANFGEFCAELARRYGPSGSNLVDAYEIWNEQNWSMFFTPTTAAAYLEYLKPAYDGIKSQHSSATVISGGTTPGATYSGQAGVFFFLHFDLVNHIDWYTAFYGLGGQNYCDAIGIHWYSMADDWTKEMPTATQIDYARVQAVRDLMVAKGDGAKQIWLTEFGFGQTMGLVKARDWLKLQVDMIQARPWIGPAFLYSYRNVGTDLSNPNNGYGVVDYKWQRKSPYYEYVASLNADTTPPTSPTGLAAGDVTSTSARITWAPASDNVGVTNYRIYTDTGVKLAEALDCTAVLTDLRPGTQQGFYVTAVDKAGNESAASATILITTDAPPGRQEFNRYLFTGSPSVPSMFLQIGLGFNVTANIAKPNAPTTDGEYWTVAPYAADQASSDHSSRITIGEAAKGYGGTSALALVRMSVDGTTWVAAYADWGGTDSVQLVMSINGSIRFRDARNYPALNPGDDLWCTADGNAYTITHRAAGGELTDVLTWSDTDGLFPGGANTRAGIGWHHRRVGGVAFPAVAIAGDWRGQDVAPVQAPIDAWQLAIVHDREWADVIATGVWETAL
ncbi:fibronectin type III domain-containing protein [Mycolicibacterium mucogenicum]|uniref:Fibronectin type-III domain-containing protein n=1 Tax=Mycolicibacterium mucogenicum DSM 44124 TaxID=1226753 RepID=A0A8H2JJ60_MYCMU|nr:fibronectin type III domain-containing protein [Mycolicibacterium mucogenicum]KAB7752872.1 hypothetical protein MMUC44124_26415 [Mycolicibacterium mucogenicum DSM 44124]QPG69077.1 hypothetical protein C1S78_027440 [Mycolicibacterium mucogenicum DSM 44124]